MGDESKFSGCPLDPKANTITYIEIDPVLEQQWKDRQVKEKSKQSKIATKTTNIEPSLSTRVMLTSIENPIEIGTKYIAPKPKKRKNLWEAHRKKLEESLTKKFCKTEAMKMPSATEITKLEIRLQAPSAEITGATVVPRKPSTSPSDIYPPTPEEKDLAARKPRSGIFINETRRKKRIKKRRRPKPLPKPDPTVEDIVAVELDIIDEVGEGNEVPPPEVPPPEVPPPPLPPPPKENYLTKQFRKKVSQLSKQTSIKSKDFRMSDVKESDGEEEEEKEEKPEDKFVNALVQKFRRDSEIKRYEPPKRKPKKGTFENFSFTKLKQPTLKTFYYGVKMGTIHQGDVHFPPNCRNRQGICMSVAAYCFSILKHPDRWTQIDIDDVLEAGNDLFLESQGSHHVHEHVDDLKIENLQKYCKIGYHKIRFKVSEPVVSGFIRSDDKKIYNLTKAIKIFFSRNSAGILQTDDFSVAIWKDKHFYFFDAKPRTIDLFSNPRGAALMANFYDTASVITVLLKRSALENSPFIIYAIKAYKVLKRDAEEVDSTGAIPEMDNFKVFDEAKAVALGSFELGDKCFGFSRNKQALTMAVVALVYSKITPPCSWHRGTIDKITIIGNQLFLECIENDTINEVNLEDLPAVFTIGPYLVEIYIWLNRFTDFMIKKGKCMLSERLEKFFEKNSNAILQIDKATLAVWKQRDMYHCYDPYSRSSEGLKCRDGAACVSLHTTLESLVRLITANFDHKDMIFRIHALKVCKIHRDPARKNLFPKGMTMNDYPMESFKNVKMKKGKRKATKSVTVDYETRAAFDGDAPEDSLFEVGSNVKSIGIDEIPSICYKETLKILPKMEPPDEDFVADLDAPSLSDTQIEPESSDEEGEMKFVDPDRYQLTQEEKEMSVRGEGEGHKKDEGDEEKKEEKKEGKKKGKKEEKKEKEKKEKKEKKKKGKKEKGSDKGKKSKSEASEEEEEEEEEDEKEESGDEKEGGGEDDWVMAASDFTQVGSHSLTSRMSQEVNTEVLQFEIPQEEIPTVVRDIATIAKERYQEPKYEFEMVPEPDVTLSEELEKTSNFVTLPDDSQIVLGTMNLSQFGTDLELMAPFVCIMANTVAKKYAIQTWSKEIVDYVLKCGAELYRTSKVRFDQSYKLEIQKISLGQNDFSVSVDYMFDTYIKPRVLAMAIQKILLPKSPNGILVTPTYSCALFFKNHLYYLFDGFGNNEVGLSKGTSNEGVACFARFTTIEDLVDRIIHNKKKREGSENIEYNRFVLSACYVKKLIKEITDEDLDDEETLGQQAEGDEPDEPVEVQTYKKKKPKDEEEKKPPKMGYHYVGRKYKIEGSRILGGAGQISNVLKEDYFACICACLLLLSTPLKKWDDKKVDSVLDQGADIFTHSKNLDVCTKKYIQNILIDDYLFDIVASRIKFTTYKPRSTLRDSIEAMLGKKHEHFILQFPNRCYVVFVENKEIYHLFDPNDKSGKASWTKYTNFKKFVSRIRSGLVKGGETYNFHSFEIASIRNAPKQMKMSNRLKKYRMLKEKKEEMVGKPFYEELTWLETDPLPWSWKMNKEDKPLWHRWYADLPNDLYTMFGSLSPLDATFLPKIKKKQTLANLVVAIGMVHIYDLVDWSPAIIDSILVNGDIYFRKCMKDVTDENHEVSIDELNQECTIFPYSFHVKFTPVVQGTMFLIRLKQFNLYKALRLFFDDYERRFGIIYVTKDITDIHQYAFGKIQDSEYFFYDCETLGPPMYLEKDTGVPYVIRTTTLNRLLYAMTVTLRGGDFYIFDVGLSKLKPVT